MRSHKLLTAIAITILLVFGSVFLLLQKNNNNEKSPSESANIAEISKNQSETEPQKVGQEIPNYVETEDQDKMILPDSILLDVPFISQAPLLVWDSLHEDACEEASLVMVKYWLLDKSKIDEELAEEEVQSLVKYEENNGYGTSIRLEQLREIAANNMGINNSRISKVSTVADIKQELAGKRAIIVGAAGKLLANPNFRNGGPNYHMLVIIGYDQNGFITNDPGTKNGKQYFYNYSRLFEAIHDWDSNNILNGSKNMLIFEPNS